MAKKPNIEHQHDGDTHEVGPSHSDLIAQVEMGQLGQPDIFELASSLIEACDFAEQLCIALGNATGREPPALYMERIAELRKKAQS